MLELPHLRQSVDGTPIPTDRAFSKDPKRRIPITTGKVLVFGSINTDFVIYVNSLPRRGETVTGGQFASFPGGKGANQAVAAARAGADVLMFGCLGDDAIGKERKRYLKDAGVSTHNIVVKAGVNSGIAQIMVDRDGQNIIAVASGANSLFGLNDITFPQYRKGEKVIALFQNEIPCLTTETAIRECKKRGMTVLWNTAPACYERPSGETLAAIDFLVCNRRELNAFGDDDTGTLARKLRTQGVKNVIVTLGEKGSVLFSENDTYHQRAFPATVVDTVGAGDCFCGVFACSLSSGMTVKDSLRRASAASAISATRRGAQTSMPFAREIDRFLGELGDNYR